ncbi:MAG: TolC family protein [Verrucomicrobia bacterium]|nr:TolC family protein [Verrucomicrobiota bacterium]
MGCLPERCPNALVPACPSYPFVPSCTSCNPYTEVEQLLARDVPVCWPCSDDSLSLTELIGLALQNSPDLRATWADARIAAAQYGIGRSEYYPDFNFNTDVLATRFASLFGGGGFFGGEQLIQSNYINYGPDVTVSYLILDFGARAAKNQALCQALLSANWFHNRSIQTVVQTVATDYYTYLGAVEQVRADTENLHDAETILDQAKAKHRAGIADLADEMNALTQVAKVQLQLLTDEQTEVNDYVALTQAAGVPANIPLKVDEMPSIIPTLYIRQHIEALVCKAYTYRPDLLAALADVRSHCAYVREQQQNRWPQINFKGAYGRTYWNSGMHTPYDGTAELSLTLPLFRGWYYENKIRLAQAELERSRATLRALQISIAGNVIQSYEDFLLSAEKVAAGEDYVKAAKINFDANLSKYHAGTADITPVIQAFANLADARSALIQARQDWYTSLINLSYAMGTLSPCCCTSEHCLCD